RTPAAASAPPPAPAPLWRDRGSPRPRCRRVRLPAASRPSWLCSFREHAAADLIELDRFEKGAKVALAEAVVALALDDLEEDRADHRVGEDLQEHAAAARRRAIDQDAIALEAREILAVAGNARVHLLVVGIGNVHEGGPPGAQRLDRG